MMTIGLCTKCGSMVRVSSPRCPSTEWPRRGCIVCLFEHDCADGDHDIFAQESSRAKLDWLDDFLMNALREKAEMIRE